MRIFGKILAAFILFFTAPSTADIISVKIRSHDRDMVRFSDFEFSHTGYVSVAVSSVVISSIPITSNSSQPDPSRIGFFLISNGLEFNPDLCALDIKYISVLFTFRDLSPPPLSSFNISYNVTYPGGYSLYFTNCNDLSLVTMDVRTELYNTDDDGATKDYLSPDQPQPSFYFKFFVVYLCFLGFWISICFNNRKYFKGIHLLMCLLLVMSILHCICAAADQQDLKVTGTHHGWQVLLYICQLMRNVVFFSVIMLIGAGWCISEQPFPVWKICSLTIVILLEVWATVSCISEGESGHYNQNWLELKESFYVIDFFSCIVVFLHTFFFSWAFEHLQDLSNFVSSINLLQGTSARPDVLSFLFLGYIFFRLITEETGNFVFYMMVFYMFRPFDHLDDEGKSCAETKTFLV